MYGWTKNEIEEVEGFVFGGGWCCDTVEFVPVVLVDSDDCYCWFEYSVVVAMSEQEKITMYFPSDNVNTETGEVVTELEVVGEGPQSFDDYDTVQYWCSQTKELKKSQVSKALKFVRFDCLRYVGENRFVCLPLNTAEMVLFENRSFLKKSFVSDYNKTVYVIFKNVGGTFECSCQAWSTRDKAGTIVVGGANCCHVCALYYQFKRKRFVRKGLSVEW